MLSIWLIFMFQLLIFVNFLKIKFKKTEMPYDEKIIINGRKYNENLPLQSTKVIPNSKIWKKLKNNTVFIAKLFLGLFTKPYKNEGYKTIKYIRIYRLCISE